MNAVAEKNMGKKKTGGEEKPQPAKKETTTTKVSSELLRQAKTVASFRGVDLYDYLDGILRDAVGRDYRAIVKDQAGEKGGA